MSKMIPLTRGESALVDDSDYEWLSQWKWYCHSDSYAARRDERNQLIYMHRLITNVPDGLVVDHINQNGLDNRRCNLRVATHRQNHLNAKPPASNTSGIKGVRWHKAARKWEVYVSPGPGKKKHLGLFTNLEDAVGAYNEAVAKLHGEFGWMNPIGGEHGR